MGHIDIKALGWERGFPVAVAQELVALAPGMDFSRVLLVTPGSRAGRLVVARLADIAEERRLPLVPPAFCTPGSVPDELVGAAVKAPTAGALARRVAWARALEQMDEETRALVFPRAPREGDFSGWFRVAGMMESCQQELAGARLTFAAVAERAVRDVRLGDAERWAAAAEAEAAYVEELTRLGLSDPQLQRDAAIDMAAVRTDRAVVLAGVATLTRQLRGLLEAVAAAGGSVHVRVFAAAEMLERFDSLGCVKPEAWAEAHLPLGRARIRIAEGPADVARAVFRAVGRIGEVPADALSLGVLDESLAPFIQTEAGRFDPPGGVPVRYGAGTRLPATRPYQFLALVADFVELGRFRSLVSLVRHPDVWSFLAARWEESPPPPADIRDTEPAPMRDWLTLLDAYAARFLPDRLDISCREPAGWRTPPEHEDPRDAADLAWLFSALCELTSAPEDPAEAETLPHHAQRIIDSLRRAYGRDAWNQDIAEQRVVIQACYCLREGLDELYAHADDATRVTRAEALRMLLSLVAGEHLAPEFTGEHIDMLNWLELMPDDAEHVVIAGFNEGIVPESTRPDPFLTNSVRSVLGLADDAERYARDACLLTAILESRPAEHVTIIAGRKTAEGDPLLPSRLLFATDAQAIARQVRAYAEPAADPAADRVPLAYAVSAGGASRFGKVTIPPPEHIRVPDDLSVTAFRDYLASPQGFYLRHLHRGGLKTLADESPRELLTLDFGTLVHDIVAAALTPAASGRMDSARGWEDALLGALHARVATVYGQQRTASLQLQVALLERRLARLAGWQHQWWLDGWRIVACEWKPQNRPALDVDGKPMRIRGRIDRIDQNQRTGQFAVLDYKICAADKTPDLSHRARGQWVDLQLPLYRQLSASITGGAPLLGFIRIADDPSCIGDALADWTDEQLRSADDTAADVIRQIRSKNYAPRGDDPPTDGIFAYIFGEGLLGVGDDETAEADA